jgi:predicted PurR-regulated permease PerM
MPAEPSDWKSLHLWQMQPVRDVLVFAGVFGVLYLGYLLSIVTVPLLLALALAYLFEPVVGALERRGLMRRPVSAIAIIVLAFLVVVVPLVGGLFAGGVQASQAARTVATKVDLVYRSTQRPDDAELLDRLYPPIERVKPEKERTSNAWVDIRNWLVEQERRAEASRDAADRPIPVPDKTPVVPAPTPDPGADVAPDLKPDAKPDAKPDDEDPGLMRAALTELVPPEAAYAVAQWIIGWVQTNAETLGQRAIEAGGGAVGAIGGALRWLGQVAFGAFLTAFFFYFFVVGFARVLRFGEGLVPTRNRERILDLVRKMDRVIAGFIRGRLTIASILIVYYVVGYWIIGVPAFLILGILVGFLTLVPYAAGIGIPVAMFLLWLAAHAGVRGEWWWVIGAPLAVHGFQQVIDDYMLTPRIQGKSTNMDMPTVLFASIAGGVLAGFYGLLLAIPVAACIKILLTEVFWPRFKEWSEGRARDFLPIGKE